MPKLTQKTRVIIYIAIAIAVIVIGAMAVLSQKSGGESLLVEKLELGQQYLLELSYDKAVLEFTDAINIEPKSADAYIGLAEAYKGLGDTEKARETLEKGYELTGDERIKALLEELDKAEGVTVETTTTETTTEETTVSHEGKVSVHLSIIDDKKAFITLEGCEIRDEYIVNLETSPKDSLEYSWCITMHGNKDTIVAATTYWAYDPGKNETKTIDQMQSDIWIEEDSGEYGAYVDYTGMIDMNHDSDSITWKVSVPDAYDFNFYNVTECEIHLIDSFNDYNENIPFVLTPENISTVYEEDIIG